MADYTEQERRVLEEKRKMVEESEKLKTDGKKTIQTDITIDREHYIQFTQEESQKLTEVVIKFEDDLIILKPDQIIPFFTLINRVKEEMAKL